MSQFTLVQNAAEPNGQVPIYTWYRNSHQGGVVSLIGSTGTGEHNDIHRRTA